MRNFIIKNTVTNEVIVVMAYSKREAFKKARAWWKVYASQRNKKVANWLQRSAT